MQTTPSLSVRMGTFANAAGVLFVVYFNQIIAIIGADGMIIARSYTHPLYLIEYLIAQPTAEQVRRN